MGGEGGKKKKELPIMRSVLLKNISKMGDLVFYKEFFFIRPMLFVADKLFFFFNIS